MNRIEFDSIWWKHTNLRPIEKLRTRYYVLSTVFFPIGITQQHITQHPVGNHTEECRWERRRAWSRARRRKPLFCFGGEGYIGSYHSQPLLGGRRKPKNATHKTVTAIHTTIIEILGCLVFSVASLGCRGTWPIELVAKLGLRPPWFFFRPHRRGTLWMICGRERGCCPGFILFIYF